MDTTAKPVLDRKAADAMNLNVLKRIDPDVDEIIGTSSHTALYDFDIPTKKWSRKEVEGSFFLVKRRSQPRFRFIILNKKGADNFIEDVDGGFQCELNNPYCLYRSKEGSVVGIWFYAEEECVRITALLNRISSTFAAPESAPAGASSQPTSPVVPAAVQQQHSLNTRSTTVTSNQYPTDDDEETVGGDAFWDKKVRVPDNVPAPGQKQQANGQQKQQQENPLAKVFAGMKVATNTSTAPPVAPQNFPLLTPEFLVQSQHQQGQQPLNPAPSSGEALLESLRGGSGSALMPMPSNTSVVASPAEHARKVQSVLLSLADNEAFCTMVAHEMHKAGLTFSPGR